MTTRIALVALLAALVLPSAVAQADNQKLVAVVATNDAFVISLRAASGNAVTQLAPGTYDIAVSDRSESHNFHLKGPGVDMSTPIGSKQETTWTVTIGEGRYTYVCDAHSALPGPALVTVNDRSKTDNFHLTGPGVNRKTGVKTRGKATWTVTLVPGL